MTTTTCPGCGSTVRPGAKFCGICGSAIKPATPAVADNYSTAAPPHICPSCGKPVRANAKFCSVCGKPISEKNNVSITAQTTEPAPVLHKPKSELSGGLEKPGSTLANPKPKAKNRIWLGLGIGLIFICGLLSIAGGVVYFRDPFGWRPPLSPTASVTLLATNTPQPSFTATQIFTETTTAIASATIDAIKSPTLALTEVTPTDLISTETPQPPSSFLSSALLFENFEGDLASGWRIWGDPRPQIKVDSDKNSMLWLTGDQPGAAGITSKSILALAPGMSIQMAAQLQNALPYNILFLDWDAGSAFRDSESPPGVLHIEIRGDKVVLQTRSGRCEPKLDGAQLHRYEIRIQQGMALYFLVDGNETSSCRIPNSELLTTGGRLTISGVGMVHEILVTRE